MSRHEYKLRITPQAQNDFIDILQYTFEKWGVEQQKTYKEHLNNALETIRDNPLIGRINNRLSKGRRCFTVKRHIIVYGIIDETIEVLRILHDRMDIPGNITHH